jgi:hypothetical protein
LLHFLRIQPFCCQEYRVVIQKLRAGVLRLKTPLGVRHVQPTFAERLYLMWVFRHFGSLPPQVLSRRAQALVSELFSPQRAGGAAGYSDEAVIGTVERIPQPGSVPAPAAQPLAAREDVAWSRRGSS